MEPETTPRNIRLGPRDCEILDHIRRYRITTVPVVHRLFFPDHQPEAVESTLRRLREAGYVASRRLFETARYYYLTPSAVNLRGFPEAVARPPGPQRLATQFGLLAYCCLTATPRVLLTLDEFQRDYPQLHERGLPSGQYYIDQDEAAKLRLGWIEVDTGAHYRRIVSKCHRRIARRLRLPAFEALIRADGFLVAVITGDAHKARALEQALTADRPLAKLRIEVSADLNRIIDTTAMRSHRHAS